MSGTDPSLYKGSRYGAYGNDNPPKMETECMGFHISFPLKCTEMLERDGNGRGGSRDTSVFAGLYFSSTPQFINKKVTWTHGFIPSLRSRFSRILQ